ncbi:Tetracycline resistance protein, class C [Rhodocyclaceae bacterium]|nr:Tetracycline resistance protein, class C [Rhodocyclaceae bacterium]
MTLMPDAASWSGTAGSVGKPMAWLGAAVFVISLGYGAGLPLLKPYVAQFVPDGGSGTLAWHVGMLGGAYTFALFLFAPWWGRLSDRYGRNVVLMAGFATFLVGGAATALAPGLTLAYAARVLAGAGAAAIMPTAQAYIADVSTTMERNRRFVLLGSAAFVGFVSGPVFGSWLAGPVMDMTVDRMPAMVNWPALAVGLTCVPILLLAPWCLGRERPAPASPPAAAPSPDRRRFVHASMLLALLASFAVGTFEAGFNLFGGETLGLASTTLAVMFVTCSLAMLAAQATLLLPHVRQRINHRWVAGAFGASALALAFASAVPDAASLGLLIAVVATGAGMIGPVLSYELLERRAAARGALLGAQSAAANLGLAAGSVSAGALFPVQPAAPFWLAGLVLLFGAGAAWTYWGRARDAETSAIKNLGGQGDD